MSARTRANFASSRGHLTTTGFRREFDDAAGPFEIRPGFAGAARFRTVLVPGVCEPMPASAARFHSGAVRAQLLHFRHELDDAARQFRG
jgi:hypothetical protein